MSREGKGNWDVFSKEMPIIMLTYLDIYYIPGTVLSALCN